MITSPSNVARTAPDIQVGMPKDASRPAAMLLLCGRLPEPKELITSATAKNIANQRIFSPCSM